MCVKVKFLHEQLSSYFDFSFLKFIEGVTAFRCGPDISYMLAWNVAGILHS